MENGAGFGNWTFPDHFQLVPNQPSGGPHHHHHHLTCLKLGKRQYCAAADGSAGGGATKRERPSPSAATSASPVVPRCQVEGCGKSLVDAKDYHRRHKVCEMHSKAPRVVVLGAEQRFCQQCSRFHAISEFDEAKRSCRRRLAGHNERRRKSNSESIIRHPTSLETTFMGSRFPYLSQSSPGCALSLLSSEVSPWISTTPELSSRSSAALRDLILENRASLLARQLFSNREWDNMGYNNQATIAFASNQHQEIPQGIAQRLDGWNQFQESGNYLTLDLMQSPNSTSYHFHGNNKSKDEEEECCEIWKSLEGTHVI